ncbi:MAG: hypothetical protein MUE69_03350 [Myxococcota bacterium]|jgi:hypothetical protein|nr:hypothetical protein [Myxococcota bacterium]
MHSSPPTSRTVAFVAFVAFAGVFGATASAQPLRRALPMGELSGLELGIEGPMTVTPGTRARWFVVAHEVVRDRDLRPARDARIEALASYEPAHPVAETRTDAYGRAVVEVAIPAELPSGFELQIDLRSERARLTRRFRVQVAVDTSDRLTLAPMRPTPRPGERVAIVGTLTDPLGGPRANATVALQAWRGAAPEGDRWELTTDAQGQFVAFVRAIEGPLRVDAEVTRDRRTVTARTAIVGTPVAPPSLVLRAVARTPVVAPSAIVEVDVQARDARGLPLEGAEVRGPALDPDEAEERATTDARGVATLRARVPAPEGDHAIAFSVVVPGLARSAVSSTIRVTRGRPVVRAVVEGGALLAGLPSRVFVRAVSADGGLLAETPLTLRIGEQSLAATTDAAGVAVLEVSIPMPTDELGEPDGCGGGTAVEASVAIAGTENRLCLPTDPDGVVRVRAEPREGELEVAVRRREDVTRAPVSIVILASRPQGLVPVHATVLAAGTSTTRFPSPNEPWMVRARALVTETHVEVRGSTVLVEPGATVDARIENDTLVAGRSLLAIALPEDEAAAIAPLPRSPTFLAARLADDAPFDDAAPAVWRRGQVVFLAPPEEPVSRGLLRDPWRQRAVYRTGRLALVLRALEAEVANASAEGDLADVAHRVGGRWQLNRALLERAISGQPLGAEGARDLGGLPLSLDQLEAADRAIDFDHLAARVTRTRLLRVLVALRELVQERGLDLVFARRGDVSTWLLALVDEGRIETSDLRDGWGGAIALRPSARPRFSLFTPVAGYELLAPGPDGAIGSRDDLWDPLARVLPSGLYADAVDEEGLLLRLRGVSLAHATLTELGAIYEAVDSGASEGATPLARWSDVPSPLTIPPIDPRPFATRPHAELVSPGTALARLALGDRPGRYVVVLYDAGEPVARAPHVRGGAASFVGQLPRRLPREPLRLRLPFVAFEALDGLRPELEVEGAEVRVLASPEALTPGTLGILEAEVRASDDGVLAVRLVDASGRVHARAGGRFTLATENATRDRRAAAVVSAGTPLRLPTEIPDDALDVRAELVALAPRRWHRDPTFVEATRARPAIGAWAEVLGGGAPDDRTRQVLAATPGDALDRACSAIVAAALAAPELARTTPEITGDLRVDAAMLAALAPAAPPPWRVGDDVFERLRRALRDASVTHADDLPVLARAAAALLLADARDESGRAILARALEILESPPEDPPAVAGDPERDALATNAALALALHRADQPERARTILARDARRVWRLFERPDETTFWWIAASAYGVAGQDATLEGASFDADGIARIPLAEGAREARLNASGEGLVLVRYAARYERPLVHHAGTFGLSIEGHPGRADRPAALELVVRAFEASDAPVLLVRLPASSVFDLPARQALQAAPGVRSVEDARDGALYVRLHPLASNEERRIPLRLRWLASGTRPGPSLAAWDDATPWNTSSAVGEPIDVE